MLKQGLPVFIVLLLLGVLFPLSAADPYLSVTLDINYSALGFATMMKPSADNTALFPDSYEEVREEAINTLLEDARWIFSGLIYGFSFRYVPGNLDESFDEVFELNPMHQIPVGDPSLEVRQVLDDYQNMIVIFNYWPDDAQARRLRIPRAGGYNGSSASGSIPMMQENARTLSLKEAVKQALRSDLRSLLYDRPLEVSGKVYLEGRPEISLWAGAYRSSLKILYRREDMKTFPANY